MFSSFSCRKDAALSFQETKISIKGVELNEAKDWYQQQKMIRSANSNQFSSISYTPDWDFAQTVRYCNSVDLLMTPIKENLDSLYVNSDYHLVFYKDSLGLVHTEMMVFKSTDDYYLSHHGKYNVNDFTGISINIDEEGNVQAPTIYMNGEMAPIPLDSIMKDGNGLNSGDIVSRGSPKCYKWGPSFFKNLWSNISKPFVNAWDWFSDLFDMGNGTPGGNGYGGGGSWGNGSNSGSGSNNGSGGFGGTAGSGGWFFGGSNMYQWNMSNYFKDYFQTDLFNTSEYKRELNKCKPFFVNSDDASTPLMFTIDGSYIGLNYNTFVSAFDYYLDQIAQGNTTYQLKDALATISAPTASLKYFGNPFVLSQWKPKLDSIFTHMQKDFKDNKSCLDGKTGAGEEGATMSCGCYNYSVEDAKKELEKFIENQIYQNLLNKYMSKLNATDLEFLKDQKWASFYLYNFLENCQGNSDSDRPDLGILGNYIRSFLNHVEEKPYFERYWLGLGDWHISKDEFDKIMTDKDNNGVNLKDKGSCTFNGKDCQKFQITTSSQSKYLLALGTFTYYVNSFNQNEGLFDYYDFDWHSGLMTWTGEVYTTIFLSPQLNFITGCTDRNFIKEWKTRSVSIAGYLKGAKPYNLFYP